MFFFDRVGQIFTFTLNKSNHATIHNLRELVMNITSGNYTYINLFLCFWLSGFQKDYEVDYGNFEELWQKKKKRGKRKLKRHWVSIRSPQKDKERQAANS